MVACASTLLRHGQLLWLTRENANSRVELDSYRTSVLPLNTAKLPSMCLCWAGYEFGIKL